VSAFSGGKASKMAMRRNGIAVLALLLCATVLSSAAPLYAVEQETLPRDDKACLQNNRIWTWRVINQRTLVVSDIHYTPFLVRLTGGCVGLTDAIMRVAFSTKTNLGCLSRGDSISYRAPALGWMSCFVTDVQPFRPGIDDAKPAKIDHHDQG
jgi:hypothetical protein